MRDILLGSHVSMNGPRYFLGSVQDALSFGENTFMFYTGAPQNSRRTPLNQCKIEEGLKLIKENGIDLDKVVVHAPYIINLANTFDKDKFEASIKFLKIELDRTAGFGCKLLVLHPGSHVQAGVEKGLQQIVKGLDIALADDENDVTICLETMAGKGSECGSHFEEIQYIIEHVKKPERLAVCLDTCHINDAGYDVSDVDAIIDEFDKTIGLDRLKVIHLNDSKNIRGSHKDRHANIGVGEIGFETLAKFVYHPKLDSIPKILETPYIDGEPPYKEEIIRLRNYKE